MELMPKLLDEFENHFHRWEATLFSVNIGYIKFSKKLEVLT